MDMWTNEACFLENKKLVGVKLTTKMEMKWGPLSYTLLVVEVKCGCLLPVNRSCSALMVSVQSVTNPFDLEL